MSRFQFDPRDRLDNRPEIPAPGHVRVRYMARSGGYIMVRKPRGMPFVLTEKQWARLPLFEGAPE